MPITRECCIRNTRPEALDACRKTLLEKYKAYASWGAAGSGDKGRKFADAFDDFMADRFIVGDEAEAADEFLRYREELGINTFILRMSWIGLEQREMLKTISMSDVWRPEFREYGKQDNVAYIRTVRKRREYDKTLLRKGRLQFGFRIV